MATDYWDQIQGVLKRCVNTGSKFRNGPRPTLVSTLHRPLDAHTVLEQPISVHRRLEFDLLDKLREDPLPSVLKNIKTLQWECIQKPHRRH